MKFPPIDLEGFLLESFTHEEYFRRRKPNGSLYVRGLHGGWDLQDHGSRTLYAVDDGHVFRFDDQPALGHQSVLIPLGSKRGYRYCHMASRSTVEGQQVRAGQPIGVMGGTGGVPVHLHFEANENADWHRPIDITDELNTLKEAWMPLNDADKKWVKQLVEDAMVLAVRGSKSLNFPKYGDPQQEAIAESSNVLLQRDLAAIKAKLGI